MIAAAAQGYKLDFWYQRDLSLKGKGAPLGTYAEVTLPSGEKLKGEAWCHHLDKPCKEVGRKLALARAISELPQPERAKVWATYFGRKDDGRIQR